MIIAHNQQNVSAVAVNRDQFDYRSVMLADANGQVNETLANQFPNREAFYRAHRDETRNEFANLDLNFANRVGNQEKVFQIAEKVFEKVQRTITINDIIPLMFHTASYGIGETPEIHEVSGGKVYERSYGAYARMSRLTQTTYTLNKHQFAIHLAEPLENLQSGRITVADVTQAMAQAILARRNRFAYDTFVSAYPTSATGYVTNMGGALTETAFKTAVRKVAKWSDVNQCRVIGNYVDVVQAADFNTASGQTLLFSDKTKDEIRNSGMLGSYSGAVIIPVKHWIDDRYNFSHFPSGSIAVVSNELGWNEFAEFGETRQDSWLSPEDGMMHWLYVFTIGAGIWKQKYGHRVYGVTNSY